MSNNHTLLVVWQDKYSRLYYHIGTLSYYNGQYEFSYTNTALGKRKLGDALKCGYMIHPAFPDIYKVYRSKTLFPAFDRRIPSSERLDFKAILSDLGLDESASKMDILQETRGRLASDTYSFEQPLRIGEEGQLQSCFFIHGMRHQNLPAHWSSWLTKNSSLKLVLELTNEYDPNAVAVYTHDAKKLGYVPNFYSKAISSLLKEGAIPFVRVVYLNEKSSPHWWVKVVLKCEVPLLKKVYSEELMSIIH